MDENGNVLDYFGGIHDILNKKVSISEGYLNCREFDIDALFRYMRSHVQNGGGEVESVVTNSYERLKDSVPTHKFFRIKADMGRVLNDKNAVELVECLNETGVFEDYILQKDVNIDRLARIVEFRENHNLDISTTFMMMALAPQGREQSAAVDITRRLLAIPDKTIERRAKTLKNYRKNIDACNIAKAIDCGADIDIVMNGSGYNAEIRINGLLLSDAYQQNPAEFNEISGGIIKLNTQKNNHSGKLEFT